MCVLDGQANTTGSTVKTHPLEEEEEEEKKDTSEKEAAAAIFCCSLLLLPQNVICDRDGGEIAAGFINLGGAHRSRNVLICFETERGVISAHWSRRRKSFSHHPNLSFRLLQNYLNESLKYLDKAYPSTSLSSPSSNHSGGLLAAAGTPGGGGPPQQVPPTAASSSASLSMPAAPVDTKPIYIDTKALLGQQMQQQHHQQEKK